VGGERVKEDYSFIERETLLWKEVDRSSEGRGELFQVAREKPLAPSQEQGFWSTRGEKRILTGSLVGDDQLEIHGKGPKGKYREGKFPWGGPDLSRFSVAWKEEGKRVLGTSSETNTSFQGTFCR